MGQTAELGPAAIPTNYNERVSFNIVWESSDEDIVPIDEEGLVRSVNTGYSEIIASVKEKPSVTKVIPVEIVESTENGGL